MQSGVRVSVLDVSQPCRFSFSYSKNNRFIDFGFFLEGELLNEMHRSTIGKRVVENQAGQRGVGFLRHVEGVVAIPGGKRTRLVHVHVLPERLIELLGKDMGLVKGKLENVLNRPECSGFLTQQRMSPNVQAVANELFCSVRNNVKLHMYMEGKVLELLGLSLLEESGVSLKAPSLGQGERDIIQAIREDLEKEYVSPPTLAEMTTRHCLSVQKIQAGFRQMFGTSVSGFVKEYRLQKAKLFFEEGSMNVSEVAWAIGYVNVSHFSAAYKKRFGVLPKAYMNAVRTKAAVCCLKAS